MTLFTLFLLTALAVAMWTVVGIIFFLNVMGYKFRKERWYDCVLLIPVIPILYVIARLDKK